MFVEKVMELVELTPIRGGLVGLPGVSGLSAEQRKRLTIAVELVANPSIIFMDEPTSGLDARAAAIVMRTLFLMKRGGQEIYVGPLGPGSCHLIQYFEGIEGVKKIKDGYNPATWMLEVTSSGQETMLGIDFADLYKNSELYRRNKALINELSTPRPGTRDLHFPTQYAQPLLTQFLACLWKQHWSYWHNPLYTAVKILYTLFLSFIVGSMFWDLGSKKDTEQDIFNAMGSMYTSVFLLGMQCCMSVQPLVAVERTVSYRERAAGMYSALPFALGQKNPVWWRWYHWACPVAWTLYGLVSSQFGDVKEQFDSKQSVQDFVRSYFGFRHDFLGVVAVMVAAFALLFAFTFAFCIRSFNFQRR
ncbi:UNVERIFIED_CONTAM: Pleiotropic drug resistance protein 1 [Sesamum radiatum]|uniref:Pleiotropic drug resistance protein 1 n=1 Tax=Sesamum radiatum TaxID=300843 RepID=A0AAW2JA39_SESRA